MRGTSKEPTIYYSHPICGNKKIGSKHEEVNCYKAMQNLKWLRKAFPQINWYCPAEVEIPIRVARKLGFLTIEQVLDIDLYIMRTKCLGSLHHQWECSNGILVEKREAKKIGFPNITLKSSDKIWECNLSAIQKLVNKVLQNSERNLNV